MSTQQDARPFGNFVIPSPSSGDLTARYVARVVLEPDNPWQLCTYWADDGKTVELPTRTISSVDDQATRPHDSM
jgi:hypothetical protein